MLDADGGTWDVQRLRTATTAAGCALWSWNVVTDEIALDTQARDLWWVVDGTPVTFGMLSERIHSADLDRVKGAFQWTRSRPGPYEIDFRIRQAGEVRWISARGQGGDTGIVNDTMFAIFMDVTSRKAAEEARDLLAGEMSHRVKNLFMIAGALTAIAARSTANTTEMAHDLTQRFTALGRAHDLAPSLPEPDKQGVQLGELLAVLLASYENRSASTDRVQISMPDFLIGGTASTTLALIVHELSTNSVKHGALSVPEGSVDISGENREGQLVRCWTERGGPPVVAPPANRGFGGKLIGRSVSGQLGGNIEFDWEPAGLIVTLTLSKSRLST